jgi:glutamate racemase
LDERPIGIFDSGLGGLTVMREMMARLPFENMVYFGDTARIPYGTRSPEIVTKYSMQCVRFLITQNVKMVVIACNTASSASLETLRKSFDIPVMGVVEPGAAMAVSTTVNKRVGIIGTEATIRSKAYNNAIAALDKDIKVFEAPCPLFVPLAEQGWCDNEIAYLTAVEYLYKLRDEFVDTLVLGCTHYPLLTNVIGKVMGKEVTLVNPAVGAALRVEHMLNEKGMNNNGVKEPSYRFFVSDFGQRFRQIGSICLGRDIPYTERVDIEGC